MRDYPPNKIPTALERLDGLREVINANAYTDHKGVDVILTAIETELLPVVRALVVRIGDFEVEQ